METDTSKVLAVDINATQKILDATAEIAFVAIKGSGIMTYFTLIDDLASLINNFDEAKKEIKDLNELEIELLFENNIEEKLTKFNILSGKSKYGIDNIIVSVVTAGKIVVIIKQAIEDGLQLSDIKALPEIFELVLPLYLKRKLIAQEFSDIQAQEAEDILIALYINTMLVLNS